MSVVGFVPNPSPSTQKVHVNLEVFLKNIMTVDFFLKKKSIVVTLF
jgi:hypothetical protein